MKKEMIKILINVNVYDEVDKIDHVFGSIFMTNWVSYNIMSADAIKQQMLAAIELVEEMCLKNIVKSSVTINKTIKIMKNIINNVKEKDQILNFITNTILARDGLGLLHGFGVAKTETNEGRRKIKARLWINPEKQSIRRNY